MYTITHSLKIRNRNIAGPYYFRAITTHQHVSRQCIYSCHDNNNEFSQKPLNLCKKNDKMIFRDQIIS